MRGSVRLAVRRARDRCPRAARRPWMGGVQPWRASRPPPRRRREGGAGGEGGGGGDPAVDEGTGRRARALRHLAEKGGNRGGTYGSGCVRRGGRVSPHR